MTAIEQALTGANARIDAGESITDVLTNAPAKLTFIDLEVANRVRCDATYHHLQTWSPTDWACAMGGECGEALNLVKKLRRLDDGDKPYNVGVDRADITSKIGDELADIVIYADLLATRLGLSLGDCVQRKFNAVSVRVGSPIRLGNDGPGVVA